MAEPMVRLSGVVKDYGAEIKTRALHSIDLTIERGDFVALIGASGSGKSTLLNILGALDRPTEGEVTIDGRRLDRMNDQELSAFRNQTLGFVFQFHYLLSAFTVKENVLIPCMIREGKATAEANEKADYLLEMVGLADKKDKRVNAISGGEQQRVAIARALVNQPRLVLADEPTGNLDTQNTERVFQLLTRICEELGTAFLIVTHDRYLARRARRILEIRDGAIISDSLTGQPGSSESCGTDYCQIYNDDELRRS